MRVVDESWRWAVKMRRMKVDEDAGGGQRQQLAGWLDWLRQLTARRGRGGGEQWTARTRLLPGWLGLAGTTLSGDWPRMSSELCECDKVWFSVSERWITADASADGHLEINFTIPHSFCLPAERSRGKAGISVCPAKDSKTGERKMKIILSTCFTYAKELIVKDSLQMNFFIFFF